MLSSTLDSRLKPTLGGGKNFNAETVINGNISTPFEIQRGCRQGDPISRYLFILAIEIFARLLKKTKIRPYATKH